MSSLCGAVHIIQHGSEALSRPLLESHHKTAAKKILDILFSSTHFLKSTQLHRYFELFTEEKCLNVKHMKQFLWLKGKGGEDIEGKGG